MNALATLAGRERLRHALLAAGVAAFGVTLSGALDLHLVDDAYITFRYAAQLVRGNGLVFNPGEWVEGYSSLLWTLVSAVPLWLVIPADRFVSAAGLLCGAAAFAVVFLTLVRTLGIAWPLAFFGILLAETSPDYWMMAANGLEGGLFSLLLACAWSAFARKSPLGVGLALALLLPTRPEGLVFAVVTTVVAIGFEPRRSRGRALALATPWLLALVGLLAWRLATYGELVPNTLLAKASLGSARETLVRLYWGSLYLGAFAQRVSPWLLLLAGGLLSRRTRPQAALALGWLGVEALAILVNGGDWMENLRLLAVLLPVLAGGALASLPVLDQVSSGRRAVLFAAFALLVLSIDAGSKDWRPRFRSPFSTDQAQLRMPIARYRDLAEKLGPILEPDDGIAPEAIGVIGYLLPDQPIHDFLGLTDAHIAKHGTEAHRTFGKSDYAYTLEVARPAILVVHSGVYHVGRMQRAVHGTLLDRYAVYEEAAPEGLWLLLRRDRADRLLAALTERGELLRPVAADRLEAR
jgi:arabinofuranosyltransferase